MTKKTNAPSWEYRDRTYVLKSGKEPITFTLASKHHSRNPLMWWDEEKGEIESYVMQVIKTLLSEMNKMDLPHLST